MRREYINKLHKDVKLVRHQQGFSSFLNAEVSESLTPTFHMKTSHLTFKFKYNYGTKTCAH